MVSPLHFRRGAVCWYDFGVPVGSEPGKRRPVVIVQSDAYNASALNTTVVVPLTSNLRYAEYADNVVIPSSASGLQKDSVALVFQPTTVNTGELEFPVAQLPTALIDKVADGISTVLGLSR